MVDTVIVYRRVHDYYESEKLAGNCITFTLIDLSHMEFSQEYWK